MLRGGSIVAMNTTVVVVSLIKDDADIMKSFMFPSTSSVDVGVVLRNDFMRDMDGNSIGATRRAVDVYNREITPPYLVSFNFDAYRLVITFLFSETVNI